MEDKLRILLIEDDPEAAQLMSNLFAGMGAGFDLTWADCLSKGMERLVPGSSPKDAILLDLSLPDSQGLDAFMRIHAKAPQTPVLLLTGTRDETLAMEAMHAGAQDYLIKNEVDGRLLVKAIRYAIERCKVKKALSDSERKLSELISRIPGVVYRCKNDPDWTMEYMGDGIQELTGYSSKGFILGQTRSFTSIIVPEDHLAVCAEIRKALDAQQSYAIEYRIITSSGDRKWMSDRGSAVFSGDNEIIAREGFLVDITRQRKAEAVLKQREEQFQALVEKSAEVILLHNKEGQRTYISPAVTSILGYSAEEYDSHNEEELIHPDDRDLVRANRFLIMERPGETRPFTNRMRHKDGSWRWVEGSARNLVGEPNIQSIVINFHDITARKVAEEALRESENKFRDLAEKSNVGIYLTEGYVFRYVNRKFAEMLSYTVEEFINKMDIFDLITPDYRQKFQQAAYSWYQDPQKLDPIYSEIEMQTKNGAIKNCEIYISKTLYQGKLAVIGTVIDITERREAEVALRESEEQLRSFFQNSADAILFTTQDGGILAANPAACRMFGRSEEELCRIGRDGVVDCSDIRFHEAIEERKQKGMYFEKEYSHIRKDGTIFPAEVSSGLFTEKDGHNRTITIIRDITRRKEEEREIRKLNEKLEERVRQRTAELTEANEALRKSESTLRSVFAASPVGIHLVSIDRKIRWMNDRMTVITGYKLEDIEDGNPRIFYSTEEEFARMGEVVFEKVLQGNSVEIETQWVRKDGQIRNIHLNVAPIDPGDASLGQVSIVTDITEQKEAQKKLLESEEQFRMVIENSSVGIALVRDGVHVYVNPKLVEIFGYDTPEELLGKQPMMTVHPDDRESIAKMDLRRRQYPFIYDRYGFKGVKKNGEAIYIEVSASSMSFHGKPSAIAFLKDVTEQKEAENRLLESEERYRAAIEHSNDGVVIVQDGIHAYVNQRFLEIFGYDSAEEVLGKHPEITVHPDDRKMVTSYGRRKEQGRGASQRYTYRGLKRDGSVIHVESSAATILFRGKRSSFVFLRDITERTRAEESLRESEEKYRTLINNMQGAVYRCDIKGNITFCSPAIVRILGCPSVESMIGMNIREEFYHHPEEWAQFLETLREQGKTTFYEITLKRKDNGKPVIISTNSQFYRDKEDNVIGIEGILNDITDRKEAEETLQRTNALLNTIIDTAPTAIIGLDLDGKVHAVWNRAAEKMLGWSAQEAMGRLFPIVPVEEKEEFERFRQSICNGQNLNGIDVRRLRRDGTPIDYSIYGSPLCDAQGRITGNITVLVDITDRKRVEQALLQAKDAAETATRAKSNFLANMSHEIRTPMNAIIGLSRLALKRSPSIKHQDYLNKIQSSARTLLGIINDILDLSKIEAGRLEINNTIFSLDKLIQNVSTVTGLKAQEKGLALSFHRDPDVPLLLTGDPLRLGQVLINLIGNAVKFTDVGEIVVEIKKTAKENTKQPLLEFSIRDTGIGMTPEQTSVIFTPFTQADESMTRRYGGTGLGLTISKQLVEQMGGTISVVSAPDIGSTFTFTISLKPAMKKREREEAHPVNLTALKVLVVDDSGKSRAILAAMLSDLSCKSICAESGAMALRELGKKRNRFDLVLVDWNMPGMDGIELAKRIKNHPDLRKVPKIILVTTHGWEDAALQAEELEIEGFLAKPIDKSILLDTIMGVLNQEIEYSSDVRSMGKTASDEMELIRGARILLVEDNEINRQVAKELLEGAGFIVELADNGLEAIERVANPTVPLDALLMDIQMPGMDGFETSRNIRKKLHNAALPIIAMTAHAMESDRQNCLQAGMNDYVPKPIDSGRLTTTLARWVKPRGGILPVARKSEKPRTTITEELPNSLPGVNVETALKRISGNKQLLAKLLLVFADNYAGAAEEIRKALSDENIDLARRLIHNLKGISGNLSADEVFTASRDLEEAIKNSDKGRETICLAKLEKGLKKVVRTVRKLSIKDATQKGPAVIQQEALPDPEKIGPLLIEMYHLLSRNSLTARKTFIALKEQFDREGPGPFLLEELEDALNRMDFKSARSYVSFVATLLGIELRK